MYYFSLVPERCPVFPKVMHLHFNHSLSISVSKMATKAYSWSDMKSIEYDVSFWTMARSANAEAVNADEMKGQSLLTWSLLTSVAPQYHLDPCFSFVFHSLLVHLCVLFCIRFVYCWNLYLSCTHDIYLPFPSNCYLHMWEIWYNYNEINKTDLISEPLLTLVSHCLCHSHSKQWDLELDFPVQFFMHDLSGQDALLSISFPTNYQETATSYEYFPIKRNTTALTCPLCKLISAVHEII